MEQVTIVKCNCNSPTCNRHSLSDGVFYQGSGWEKERAQEYADAINNYARVLHERNTLAEAIIQAATERGIINDDAPLEGAHLLLLLKELAK